MTTTMKDWANALIEASRLLRERQPARDASGDFERLMELLSVPVGRARL